MTEPLDVGASQAGREALEHADAVEHEVTIPRAWWWKPILGIVVLAAILLAAPIYGRLTSGGKISDAINRDAATVNVTVDLPWAPDAYHRETLSELGVFAGRDRNDESKIRLRAVTQDDLNTIANFFWVDGIEPT